VSGLDSGDTVFVEILNAAGTVVRSGNATVAGTDWTFAVATDLTEQGAYTIRATVVDSAANPGSKDESFTFTLDTVAPSKPGVPSIVDDSDPTNPVVINPGDETKDDTPVVSGIVDEPGSTIVIIVDGEIVGEIPSDPGDGSWTWTPPAPGLEDSEHEIEIVVRDPAGNESPPSDAITIIVDTKAPTSVSTITAISEDRGVSETDFITNDPTLVISGTLSEKLGDGENVQIRIGDGAWVNATVTGADGLTWEYDNQGNPLADGSYQVETRTIDKAGNITSGNDKTIVIDLTPPEATPTINMISADSGEYYDFITDDQTLAVYGTVDKPLKTGDIVQIRFDDGEWLTATYNAAGVRVEDGVTMTWVYDHTSVVLADGQYKLDVRVMDAGGNIIRMNTTDPF